MQQEMKIEHTEGMQFICSTRNHSITVDLPPSYNGADTGPTPPELLIASLGSCIGVYVVMNLNSQGVSSDGVKVSLTWEDEKSPARISKINANIELPESITTEQAEMALKAAGMCKVHNTLHNSPEICVVIADRPEICLP